MKCQRLLEIALCSWEGLCCRQELREKIDEPQLCSKLPFTWPDDLMCSAPEERSNLTPEAS